MMKHNSLLRLSINLCFFILGSKAECGEDADFRFIVPGVNGSKMKSCAWAGRIEEKVDKRCAIAIVSANCPITCDSCPSESPSSNPTRNPTKNPTKNPTQSPTISTKPSKSPTKNPTPRPTKQPTRNPTKTPTKNPTKTPTRPPTPNPTKTPTKNPTKTPTTPPTKFPTRTPTRPPTKAPTKRPTSSPTVCEDAGGGDVDYKFVVPGVNGSKKKSCDWAVRRDNKKDERCAIAVVAENCQRSCDLC